jgi:undecaprenyl-diphosphatase
MNSSTNQPSRSVACLPGMGERPLLIIALACLLAVVLLAAAVALAWTRSLDLAIIRFVRADALVQPLGFLRHVTITGSTPWITAMALLVLVVELLRRRPWLGIAASATIGAASLLDTLAKDVVRRSRPDLLPPIVIEPGYSFPSGHATLSTVAYGIMVLLLIHSRLPRAVKIVAVGALAVLVLLVGLSRIYLGVHYPSDVLGGWLTGAVVVLLFEALVRSRLAPRVSREASTAPGGGAAAWDREGPRSGPPAPE